MSKTSEPYINPEPKPNKALAVFCCCFKTALQVGTAVATGVVASKIGDSNMTDAQKTALTNLSTTALDVLGTKIQEGLDEAAKKHNATLDQNPDMASALTAGAVVATPLINAFAPVPIAGTVNTAINNNLRNAPTNAANPDDVQLLTGPRVMVLHDRALIERGGVADVTHGEQLIILSHDEIKQVANNAIKHLKDQGLITATQAKHLGGGSLNGTNAGKALADLILHIHNEKLALYSRPQGGDDAAGTGGDDEIAISAAIISGDAAAADMHLAGSTADVGIHG